MKITNPFHSGELAIQEQLQEQSTAILNGRLYEDQVMMAAHKFLSQQSYLIISTAHSEVDLPVSIVFGEPGFVSVEENGKHLHISLAAHKNMTSDPVLSSLKENLKVGILAIELSTRRRLRINGLIQELTPKSFKVIVEESYPNCPKYIQKRALAASAPRALTPQQDSQGTELTPWITELIQKTDTFFVSSFNPNGHADASHRGGPPGFIQILDNGELRIPDYPGNSLYNTFGNFHVNPNAGFLIWDFEASALLHMRGRITLDLKNEALEGQQRWWNFQPTHWQYQTLEIPFAMTFTEFSPFLPKDL